MKPSIENYQQFTQEDSKKILAKFAEKKALYEKNNELTRKRNVDAAVENISFILTLKPSIYKDNISELGALNERYNFSGILQGAFESNNGDKKIVRALREVIDEHSEIYDYHLGNSLKWDWDKLETLPKFRIEGQSKMTNHFMAPVFNINIAFIVCEDRAHDRLFNALVRPNFSERNYEDAGKEPKETTIKLFQLRETFHAFFHLRRNFTRDDLVQLEVYLDEFAALTAHLLTKQEHFAAMYLKNYIVQIAELFSDIPNAKVLYDKAHKLTIKLDHLENLHSVIRQLKSVVDINKPLEWLKSLPIQNKAQDIYVANLDLPMLYSASLLAMTLSENALLLKCESSQRKAFFAEMINKGLSITVTSEVLKEYGFNDMALIDLISVCEENKYKLSNETVKVLASKKDEIQKWLLTSGPNMNDNIGLCKQVFEPGTLLNAIFYCPRGFKTPDEGSGTLKIIADHLKTNNQTYFSCTPEILANLTEEELRKKLDGKLYETVTTKMIDQAINGKRDKVSVSALRAVKNPSLREETEASALIAKSPTSKTYIELRNM